MFEDAESTWVHKADSLNYIHIRHMTSGIKDWSKLLAQAYR